MGEAARRTGHATFDDIAHLGEDARVEIIGGEIVPKDAAKHEHSAAQGGMTSQVWLPFSRLPGHGGPGGWWFGTEAEVEYEPHELYLHDVAGWRRERSPERPTGRPVRIAPDWVCEILSPSNWANDTVTKFATMQRHAVPHYWILDVEHRILTVYRWKDGAYVVAAHAQPGERAALEPFDAVTVDVGVLFGDDPTE